MMAKILFLILYQILKKGDDNILIDRNMFLHYDGENFSSRKKRISDNIYKMIQLSFFENDE